MKASAKYKKFPMWEKRSSECRRSELKFCAYDQLDWPLSSSNISEKNMIIWNILKKKALRYSWLKSEDSLCELIKGVFLSTLIKVCSHLDMIVHQLVRNLHGILLCLLARVCLTFKRMAQVWAKLWLPVMKALQGKKKPESGKVRVEGNALIFLEKT